MKTVMPAKANIAQLWGNPKPQDKTYRLMKYLIRVDVDEGVLLHNTVTRHLVLLSNEEANLLSELPAEPTEQMQELIANHFLVPEDFDEYRSVNQLRKVFQSRSTGDMINHYVILPTTFCNAHCFYCYESDYPHIHMSEETARKLIDYIDEHRKGENVSISWFGGEPLVGVQRIDQISQGLKDRGITFKASMISNGYLFDEKIIDRAKELWNLQRVQITLDGTEDVYNRVKAYANAKENPFQRVVRNIGLLSENNIHVSIRLNVDFYNKEDIRELIEDLGKRYSGNERISVYLNMLFNNQGFDPVHHSQDEVVQLQEIIDEYTNRLRELKLGDGGHKIPLLQFSQCMADNPHTVEVQPDGSFCRCEHENVNDSYGSIDKGILDPEALKKWQETIQRSADCPECCLYPFCFLLKRCMNADTPCVESIRLRSLVIQKKLLRSVYQKKLEEDEK